MKRPNRTTTTTRRALPPAFPRAPAEGSWGAARELWESGRLAPLEKALAVLAVGQLMRLAVGATGFWRLLHEAVPVLQTQIRTNEEDEEGEDDDEGAFAALGRGEGPIHFFKAVERGGVDLAGGDYAPSAAATTLLVPQRAARAFLRRCQPGAAGK